MVEASPERQQNFTRLCTISGVGPVVGTALVNTLERVPVKSDIVDNPVIQLYCGNTVDDSAASLLARKLKH